VARTEIGKYLAVDTRVCNGRLIFKGARILVSDALELVEAGYDPDAVAQQYRGAITADAVRKAISLTQQGMVKEDWSRNPA
jgi:uncharacterized protein (DUF433 family)